ncbi:MAG: response regulator [Desulfovibrio sp.]|jgi:putative two-component system response regulator|nr:response regulator [Desulfovibrio sp.]
MERPPAAIVAVVDDNETARKHLCAVLKKEGHLPVPLSKGSLLLRMLEKAPQLPDLILLDLVMPELSGYETMTRIMADPRFSDIPVIFVTAAGDVDSQLRALDLGAVDYVTKLCEPKLLLRRIATHLQQARDRKTLKLLLREREAYVEALRDNLSELKHDMLMAIGDLVEFRDSVTGGHSSRTVRLLDAFWDELLRTGVYADTLSTWDKDVFLQSSLLHDVGKIPIPDSILLKPGILTPEEREVMKRHTEYGAKIVDRIQGDSTVKKTFLHHARRMAATHHEKWDGTGYMQGLAGEDIPLEGRIMAYADVYDALISDRPYKRPFPKDEALRIMREGAGRHFDPHMMKAFLTIVQRDDVMEDGVAPDPGPAPGNCLMSAMSAAG